MSDRVRLSLRFRRLIIPALVSCLIAPVKAQWTQILTADRPASPKVFALAVNGIHVFAGFESDVLRSSDNGATWSRTNIGSPALMTTALSLHADGTDLYAGTAGGGLYRSSDHGASWNRAGLAGAWVASISSSGHRLFAGISSGGMYRSDDKGVTWIPIGLADIPILSVEAAGSGILAGTSQGLFRADDGGGSWRRVLSTDGLPSISISRLAAGPYGSFAGTPSGLYRSSDNGFSWMRTGLPDSSILSIAVRERDLFAGTAKGIFHSTDNGATWEKADAGMASATAHCLAFSGAHIFAGIPGGGIWRRPLAETGVALAYPAMRAGKAGSGFGTKFGNRGLSGMVVGYRPDQEVAVGIGLFDIQGHKVGILSPQN